MNDYYDPKLKEYRCSVNEQTAAASRSSYTLIQGSIADKILVDRIFRELPVRQDAGVNWI